MTKRPEQALQIAVARYLDVALPADAVFWHTPNGGGRTKAEGAIFKAMGVKAGFPDIAILYLGKLYCIELKAPNGRTSMPQQTTMWRLREAGAEVVTHYSLTGVHASLVSWAIPLRARPQ